MLRHIEAENYFVFEDFSIDFPRGMSVITGETGSGKSMVLRSMGLVLGDSFAHDLIRDHDRLTRLRIVFDISANAAARLWLDGLGIGYGDGQLEILRSARYRKSTRAEINGRSSDISQLRELAPFLVEIHGQKTRHSLFSGRAQLAAFDDYAQSSPILDQVRASAERIDEIDKLIADIGADSPESIELIRYQHDELAKEDLRDGLWEELQTEHRRLSGYEQRRAAIDRLCQLIQGEDDGSVQQNLHRAGQLADELAESDSGYRPIAEMLERARIETQEAAADLASRSQEDAGELNPAAALDVLDKRIAALFDLARKHKTGPARLAERQQQLEQRIERFDQQAERLAGLESERGRMIAQWREQSSGLSELRRQSAGGFAAEVNGYLEQLNMEYADFRVEFEQRPEDDISPAGREKAHFLISTVSGKAHEPINRISSGGELSRISLAVRLCASQKSRNNDAVLVFDEIDAGIGGQSADRLGRLLAKLAGKQQILCVTHLATVAAQASAQFQVGGHNERQSARLEPIKGKARVSELARMLTGDSEGRPSLSAARELLNKAGDKS